MSQSKSTDMYDDKREPEAETEVPKKQKLTNWKNEPTFEELYQNYMDAQEDHGKVLNDLERRKINMDGGSPIGAPKGKSNARPKLIKKQAEWKYPSLEEPFLNTVDMFEVNPQTFEDREAAEQNELLLNYQWRTKIDKVELVGDIVRTIVDDGTVIVKIGWESDEDEIMVDKQVPVYASPEESMMMIQQALQSGQISEEQANQIMMSGQPMVKGEETIQVPELVLVKNNPTYEVCDTRNVILDPTANGKAKDLQFAIHEYDTSMSELNQEKYSKTIVVDPETGSKTVDEYGTYKNLDKIVVKKDSQNRTYVNDSEQNETTFEFNDKPRQKLRAYEYWGYWDINNTGETEVIIATWIGKTIIRMEKSPFPFNGLPFSFAKYMPKKNDMYGEADGDLLIENQESIGRMKRAAYDITADIAVGQEFIDEQFFAGPSQKDNYNSGKTVYFRHGMDPKTAIHKKSIDPVPKAVFDMIALENNDAESITGTKAFSQGIGSQALGNVVAGIRSALDATSKRELSILRRISEQLFKDMGGKTIQMNQAFLDEEEVIRITNKKFVTISRNDIAGEFDLIIDVSTPEKDNDKAEKLNTLMQTNAASMHPGLQKIIYAKMAKLWKEPDLAEEVLSFEPDPDPMADAIKKLQFENAQLENKKLHMEIAKMAKDIESEDSKIDERISRTSVNLDSESEENIANARLRNAQAEKLEEESDMIKLDFARTADGTKRKEQEEDIEVKHMASKEMEEMKYQGKMDYETEKQLHDFAMDDGKQLASLDVEINKQSGTPGSQGA
ncbi:MAG: hypothetical protein KAH01_02170 [Caldisericia bacterium]|nr:hypothetical protein [Caldisericia bacterium]